MAVEATRAAVDWALSRSRSCDSNASSVSDTVAQNVIETATSDGVVDVAERAELSRFAANAALTPVAQGHMLAAFALPKESADSIRRRRQLEAAGDVARQGLATGTNEGAALGVGAGLLLGLNALFGGR